MSGHSHWATIKRKKGAADAKKGQIYTRLAREIVMAARDGGGDINSNFRLQLAVERARSQNMPKDSIERAIKRGSGEDKEGADFEEIYYEGYAPHGIAVMIECATDNRNRAVAEIRHALTRSGGNMAEVGSVAWQFTRTAYFYLPAEGHDVDKILELAVDGGANDVISDEDEIEIIGPVEAFKTISDKLAAANIHPDDAGIRMSPSTEIELPVDETLQVLRAIEGIEELDDVQAVFSNLKYTKEALAALENE
ncbi:MAG: YebC/PmpR family DNA-binding transcriptional regulator [Anaerolineaceae bacterium]|nr:YebC/PmpR family DNA-binding transcriptional regulator [Anaerolineaceae bacterium]MBN2677220.1 YebC/PmpR family DNA-binding transcriptional regulator [Anaerolineaceae bacterium]